MIEDLPVRVVITQLVGSHRCDGSTNSGIVPVLKTLLISGVLRSHRSDGSRRASSPRTPEGHFVVAEVHPVCKPARACYRWGCRNSPLGANEICMFPQNGALRLVIVAITRVFVDIERAGLLVPVGIVVRVGDLLYPCNLLEVLRGLDGGGNPKTIHQRSCTLDSGIGSGAGITRWTMRFLTPNGDASWPNGGNGVSGGSGTRGGIDNGRGCENKVRSFGGGLYGFRLGLALPKTCATSWLMLRATRTRRFGALLLRRVHRVVLESPVRSGFLTPEGLDRDRDRSTFILEVKKTGPDRKKTETAVFCSF